MDAAVAKGIRLFNKRMFFEAHEALEAVWLHSQGDERALLHGLIQVAAAFHHQQHGNIKGFRRVFEKGVGKLESLSRTTYHIDLADLLTQLEPWRAILSRAVSLDSLALPSLPRIRPTAGESLL